MCTKTGERFSEYSKVHKGLPGVIKANTNIVNASVHNKRERFSSVTQLTCTPWYARWLGRSTPSIVWSDGFTIVFPVGQVTGTDGDLMSCVTAGLQPS